MIQVCAGRDEDLRRAQTPLGGVRAREVERGHPRLGSGVHAAGVARQVLLDPLQLPPAARVEEVGVCG